MQKMLFIKNRFVGFLSFVFLTVVILSSGSCSGRNENIKSIEASKQVAASDNTPGYVKFISFQNSDSTWGFTVFVNSRPYLHYKRMPYQNARKGFPSKKDAEKIAAVFAGMIRSGDLTPQLENSTIDSLKMLINRVK